MIRATLARPELGGLYNAVAAGETSWHGYACHVIDYARARGVPIKVSREHIRALPTSQYPTPAARPLNSRLSTAKLQQAFGLTLPSWQSGVERMLAEILPS
jgi:dTDP-4-dehydrorhamnose reductase